MFEQQKLEAQESIEALGKAGDEDKKQAAITYLDQLTLLEPVLLSA